MYNPHFKISETENSFGEKYNDCIEQIIITSVKDAIYQKRKNGDSMYLSDVKRYFLRNLHIMRSHEIINPRQYYNFR